MAARVHGSCPPCSASVRYPNDLHCDRGWCRADVICLARERGSRSFRSSGSLRWLERALGAALVAFGVRLFLWRSAPTDSALEEFPEASPSFFGFLASANPVQVRSFKLMTVSLLRLTLNALPHSGTRSIAERCGPGKSPRLMSIAVHLRFAVVAAATLLLGPTGLKGGDDFSREVLVMREKPGDRRWEIALETGALFGVRNPNNYVIAPQLLSLAWQPFPQWQIGPVRIRGQILATFAGEAILHGPESYFLGGALRARLIFPLGTSPWSLYADGGGGIGAIDSDDTPFGQGEDFAFCLLASGGVRFAFSRSWSVWTGFFWQHLSNADISEPRAGIPDWIP